MPLDIGGGSRGGGGPLSDSVDISPPSPAIGRTLLDYNPVNARLALETRLAQERLLAATGLTVKRYVLKLVGADVILASEIFNGAVSSQQVVIAKPYDLRRTPFDGLTVGGYTYAYTSNTARTRTDADGLVAEQTIQEPYTIDSEIIWAVEAESTGLDTTNLLDINANAKHWDSPGTAEINRYRLVSQIADTLSCTLLDDAGADTGSVVFIAKPPLLRRTPFDNLTYNGISYVYTGNAARVATKSPDIQNEIIIPPYINGISIIHAINVTNKTGIPDVTLLDLNVDARLWARA